MVYSSSLNHVLTPLLVFLPGDHTEGDTPDPIPNSVVKPLRADGSDPARDRESRSSPGFFFPSTRPAFCCNRQSVAYVFAITAPVPSVMTFEEPR